MASSEFINKVEVLFDGFSRMEAEGSSVMYANCSCSLVIGEDVKIIVDTMTPWDGPRLLNALAKRGITPDEVFEGNYILEKQMYLVITHICYNAFLKTITLA